MTVPVDHSSTEPLVAVRRGCTRLCLLVGPWAVKVPNVARGWRDSLFGLIGNTKEAELSRRGWPELCPVLWRVPGGFLLVMRRARVMTEAEFAAFDAPAFCDRPERPVPAERKPDSFGWLGGRPVVLDYGC